MRLLQLVPSILLIGNSVSAASVFSRPQAQDHQVAELSGTVATIDTVSLRVRPDDGSSWQQVYARTLADSVHPSGADAQAAE